MHLKYRDNITNKDISEITNINAHSSSFDFLARESDLYNIDDLQTERYKKKLMQN